MKQKPKEEPKFPAVRGRIVFEGIPSAKFWIRVFALEDQITFVQAKINEKAERKVASVPVISEYTVDPEKLIFYYAMHLKVDALGLQDGIGIVYYADKANAEQAQRARDELGVDMLKRIEKRAWDESFEMETYVTPPGKEAS